MILINIFHLLSFYFHYILLIDKIFIIPRILEFRNFLFKFIKVSKSF